jgi:hypothetical protein
VHRIDEEGALRGMFTEGDAGQSIPATKVSDDWLNDVQGEIASFIEAAGIALVKGNRAQLRGAVDAFIAAHNAVTNPHSATSAATASRLALRDAAGRCQFAAPAAAGDAVVSPVPRAHQASVGQQVSASSGSGPTMGNLSVTITTTGRPVVVALQPDGTTSQPVPTGPTTLQRGGSTVALSPSGQLPWIVDAPAAGTYIYSALGSVTHVRLVAYEL